MDYEEDEEEEEESTETAVKRQQLKRSIDLATDALRNDPSKAQAVYDGILAHCERDLQQLEQIQNLLVGEFLIDHKREQVTQKVRELVSHGHKVLLISTFSDTVVDYFRYMAKDSTINASGIGMAIGSTKNYYSISHPNPLVFSPNNVVRNGNSQTNLKRASIFRLFAPVASCKNPGDRPKPSEEIAVLIGSETLSVGQNLQDADYLINIDLPWNPMILEQRIGRIDRPKQHRADNIYIYYANSESQLLRQASRLNNLNKKLVGEIATSNGDIPTIANVESLGASIYGDTLFDDEILPGYIDFLNSLVRARKLEQGNLQEDAYQKQETSSNVYTQNEILHGEELSKLVKELGDDYQANPITLGRCTGGKNEPTGLVALTVQYFGPNGEPIPDKTQTIYWNDQTGEKDGYGIAIATAFKTPVAGDIFSAKYLLKSADSLYTQLVAIKQQWAAELQQEEALDSINATSERITKIQRRVSNLDTLPAGLDRKTVRDTLKKLSTWKALRKVQKILRDFTDGNKAALEDDEGFLVLLVRDTQELNLIANEGIKPISLKASLAALLLRA